MRLVKLSDLSEEERKKALEEQQERLNRNRQEAQNIQNQANNDFNNYIQKHGNYDTNQHTTSIGDIKKAYKNTSSYDTVKSSLNNYYKNNNNTSLWDNVKSLANDLGYITKKTGAGVVTGTTGIAQGQLTDVANSLQNGKEKSKAELTTNFLRNLQGLTNPMQAYNNILKSAPQNILNTIKTISDKAKNAL